jgi:hypothetical protein
MLPNLQYFTFLIKRFIVFVLIKRKPSCKKAGRKLSNAMKNRQFTGMVELHYV